MEYSERDLVREEYFVNALKYMDMQGLEKELETLLAELGDVDEAALTGPETVRRKNLLGVRLETVQEVIKLRKYEERAKHPLSF